MSLLRGVVSRRRSGPRGNLVGAAEAAPTGSFTPGSTAPAQQAAADLHQVAEAQLSIAVLVEHREIGRAHVELQSLMRISYAVFCLKKKNKQIQRIQYTIHKIKSIIIHHTYKQ